MTPPFNKHSLLVTHLHDDALLDMAEDASRGEELNYVELEKLGQSYCELESVARSYVDQIGELRASLAREQLLSNCAVEIIADLKAQLERAQTDEDDTVEIDQAEVEAMARSCVQ